MIGRGAADMKGGDAAILAVLEHCARSGAPTSSASSTTARRGRTARTASTRCWRSRSCSAGPPSRSSASRRAATSTPAASASSTPTSSSTAARPTARGPWEGDSAILRAVPFLERAARMAHRPVEVEGLTFHDTLCITQIHGGVARNVVPDRVELALNVRFAPGPRGGDRARRDRAARRGRGRADVARREPGRAAGAVGAAARALHRRDRRAGAAEAGLDGRRLAAGARHPGRQLRPRRGAPGAPARRVGRRRGDRARRVHARPLPRASGELPLRPCGSRSGRRSGTTS